MEKIVNAKKLELSNLLKVGIFQYLFLKIAFTFTSKFNKIYGYDNLKCTIKF